MLERAKHGGSRYGLVAVLLVGSLLFAGLPAVGSAQAVGSARGMAGGSVAAATENARVTRAALSVMENGGNAMDAAVAAAFVAGVVSPSSSGIGGGCFVNLYDARSGAVLILDARETAPMGLVPEEFEARPFAPEARGKWVGVPGEVRGLHELHRRFGKRPWAEVLAPAIQAAEFGYQVHPHLVRVLSWFGKSMQADPALREMWLSRPIAEGTLVKNPKLAKTLRRIAQEGPNALYEGTIAAELVNLTRAHGGSLSLDDLRNYRVQERQPLAVRWGELEVFTMPPPSAGGLMLTQTLALFSKTELQKLGHNSPAYQHALAEAFRGAFADRMRYVGDPDFEPVPLGTLLDEARMQRRRQSISLERTRAIPRFVSEEHGTHHLITADTEGNVVSLTTTINRGFGAKLTGPESGILLNDELEDFTLQADAATLGLSASPNRARPGARPVSSMTPTLVLERGKPVLAAGGSGGLNIAPDVSQVVISQLTFGIAPKELLQTDRFQLPLDGKSTILVPAEASREHVADLERRGEVVGRVRFNTTAVQLLTIDGYQKRAGADPRKFGHAAVK